jgi:hypothetical protein
MIWQIMDILAPIAEHRGRWQKYVTPYQVTQLIHQPERKDEWVALLKRDFDNLSEFDRIKEGLLPHEKETIDRLFDKLQRWDIDAFVSVFQNSLRVAWIEHLEMKYPVLRSASTLKMDDMQSELQRLSDEKMALSKEILLLRAREGICESIEYNRLNNRVTYRDLHHQVTKKKKIWPVRKLISEYYTELFKIVPCWMASPESVSAIFPMEQLFDVVIFDEASQCFAERGIPALCRGSQVLVAGDDKQLRPFDLYQSRLEEESEAPELEADSLLELSSKYLETTHLRGHYRSKSLELIDFSNRHFYNGKLQLLPDKRTLDLNEPAIEYRKVEGVWEHQTNLPEAQQVVDVVLKYVKAYPEKEIGVVTFNLPQQLLIMDLLEAAFLSLGQSMPPSLFVKNIENVQGDEKDIIIFSIGYAADENNKLSMQFGSLNVAGGENRLNVAVTRAREKVIIVSSIWPEALRVQGIQHDGPKLLKRYLEYAREVSAGRFKPTLLEQGQHNADWYLRAAIVRWSVAEKTSLVFESGRLPSADITLTNNNKPAGMILTDDVLYEQMYSVKDAHVYTPQLLEQKHWTHHRVFSRNWWMDRERVQHELTRYIYQLNESL